MVADDPVVFNRTPYTVRYVDMNGKQQTIRRVPPEKLHPMLPTDVVELTEKRSDDFKAGDTVEVKYINPRHPNVLQLQNDRGDTTFVEYYDLNMKEEVAMRDGEDPRDKPINNKYLLWP
jgi:hypothetical protein